MLAAGTDWLGQVKGLCPGAVSGALEPGFSPGSLEPESWARKLQGRVSVCLATVSPAPAEHLEVSVGVLGGSGYPDVHGRPRLPFRMRFWSLWAGAGFIILSQCFNCCGSSQGAWLMLVVKLPLKFMSCYFQHKYLVPMGKVQPVAML